jgi:hypothetical protein
VRECEDPLNPDHLSGVAGHENGTIFSAGVREEDVQREASLDSRQLETLLFAENGECESQGIPAGRARCKNTTAANERPENVLLEPLAILR